MQVRGWRPGGGVVDALEDPVGLGDRPGAGLVADPPRRPGRRRWPGPTRGPRSTCVDRGAAPLFPPAAEHVADLVPEAEPAQGPSSARVLPRGWCSSCSSGLIVETAGAFNAGSVRARCSDVPGEVREEAPAVALSLVMELRQEVLLPTVAVSVPCRRNWYYLVGALSAARTTPYVDESYVPSAPMVR